MTLYYGDKVKLKNEGYICRLIGSYTDENGEQCYELMPLVEPIIASRDYIENECTLVYENPLGVELKF